MRCENDMSTSSTSSKFCPSRTSIAASSTPTYAKDIHLTPSNSDSLHLVCDLCVREDQHLADQGVIQEPTDGVHCAAGSSRAAVTASLEGFLQVCEVEAQLRVVWIGSVVVSVELAIRVVGHLSRAGDTPPPRRLLATMRQDCTRGSHMPGPGRCRRRWENHRKPGSS